MSLRRYAPLILIGPSLLLLGGIFVLDLVTPVSFPAWLLYLVPLFVIPSAAARRYPVILAGICTVLIFAAYGLSSEDAMEVSTLVHRVVVVSAVWGGVVFWRLWHRTGQDASSD
jgi:membrane protease YdiL (CAAX protease family)